MNNPRPSNLSRLMSCLCAVVLASVLAICAVPARLALAADAAISIAVIGPEDEVWASDQAWGVDEGATAADASETFFAAHGLVADAQNGSYGWFLNTLSNGGEALGYDQATGKFWQLYVNGAASQTGASSVELRAGDSLAWYYSAQDSALPDVAAGEQTADEVTATAEAPAQESQAADTQSANGWVAPVVIGAAVVVVVVVAVAGARRKQK